MSSDRGPFTDVALAAPGLRMDERADGTLVLSSSYALASHVPHVGHYLRHWAERDPERIALAERTPAGPWRELSYGALWQSARRMAQALHDRGHGAERPLMVLSDNGVNQAVLKFGAMLAGIPFVPVSPAYSLMSQNFAKLKGVFDLIRPGLVYVSQPQRYARALAALPLDGGELVVDEVDETCPGALPFSRLLAATASGWVDQSFDAVGPDTVAKILLTSGSTGLPKGVLNTHRMMCSNMAAVAQLWPFLTARPPVIVDWLPWNHTFGTNFNINQILAYGGTMYLDAGKPVPGLIETTLKNLREIRPTLLYNVPRGYDMLISCLDRDEELCDHLFSDLDVMFYAGAALPQVLWDRLEDFAVRVRGRRIPILSALGSTETAPVATLSHWGSDLAGNIGLPIPGTEIKLVKDGGKLEIRVRGPNVTPGYYRQPELNSTAFDEEGFFKLGDAVKFIDRERPEQGLLFDGRVAENFKLLTGVWVHVGDLRVAAINAASPVILDAVVTGHGREEVGLLVFPNEMECRSLCGATAADLPVAQLIRRPEVRRHLVEGLSRHNAANPGSSTRISRVLVLETPPSVDAHEITDKGYINQRAVLEQRHALVEALYASPARDEVIVLSAAQQELGIA